MEWNINGLLFTLVYSTSGSFGFIEWSSDGCYQLVNSCLDLDFLMMHSVQIQLFLCKSECHKVIVGHLIANGINTMV